MNDETAELASLGRVLNPDWFNAPWVARINSLARYD